MNLMKIAHVPPVMVDFSATVLDAIKVMVDNNAGAVVVATEGKIRGIVAERDILRKVVYHNLPPDMTPVGEIMTKEVESIGREAEASEALRLMLTRHIRHLPIVDDEGNVIGILSVLDLLQALANQRKAAPAPPA